MYAVSVVDRCRYCLGITAIPSSYLRECAAVLDLSFHAMSELRYIARSCRGGAPPSRRDNAN